MEGRETRIKAQPLSAQKQGLVTVEEGEPGQAWEVARDCGLDEERLNRRSYERQQQAAAERENRSIQEMLLR